MKQLTIEEVMVNGFAQNCYKIGTRGGIVGLAQKTAPTQKTFETLEKKMLPNGYVHELVEKDYPITSASVTSYADGADYRNDPAQAVANAPKRVNLGDITETQKFANNPQDAMRLYDSIKQKLDAYYQTLVKGQQQQQVKNEEGDKQ